MKDKETKHSTKNNLKYLWKYLCDKKFSLFICFLLVFIGTGATLIVNYEIKPVVNDYILPKDWSGLKYRILFLILLAAIGSVANWTQMQVVLKIAYNALTNIRKDLFEKLQKLPISYYDQHSHGDIMSLFTNDIEAVSGCLEQSVVMILNNTVRVIGTLILMFLLSPTLLVVTLIMTVVMLIAMKITSARTKEYFDKQQKDIGKLCGFDEEMIDGQYTIRAFSQEEQLQKTFQKINSDYQKSSTSAQAYTGSIMPIINQINSINLAITAIVGSILAINGNLDVGALSASIVLATNYNDPFKQISMQLSNILQGLAGAKRIFSVIEMDSEVDEGKVVLIKDNKSAVWEYSLSGGKRQTIPFEGNIIFNNVNFGYSENKTVLKNITLEAKPGQKIALVGSTGSGKTTIANLINRFYDIEKGEILFDGININNIKKDDLRECVGMVLQDTHLFTGTIFENIKYGCLDATDEDVMRASKLSRADYFIRQLPDAYETKVEKDGENLSSGQRQLIAIARTALSNPKVLVLDEATSAVDTRTESFINKGMDELMKGRTVFVIAHRLSTIRDADIILVLEDGKIIERGNHDQLVAQRGRYYELNSGTVMLE